VKLDCVTPAEAVSS